MTRRFLFALVAIAPLASYAANAPEKPESPLAKEAEPCLVGTARCEEQDPRPVKPCLAEVEKCDQAYQVQPVAPRGVDAGVVKRPRRLPAR